MKRKVLCLVVALLAISTAHAAIVSYDYDSALGADPTAQGFTKSLSLNGGQPHVYIDGYDTSVWNGASPADVGGWRVIDLSDKNYAYYMQGFDEQQISDLSGGWTTTWTFAMDKDSWGNDGVTTYDGDATYDDYFATSTRQTAGAILFETRDFACYLWVSHDGSNVVIQNQIKGSDNVNDTYTLTDSEDLYYTMRTITLNYDGTDLEMVYGGTTYDLDCGSRGEYNRLGFGSFSTPGTGSLVYDEITVVPEPATMILLGLGGLVLGYRRRRA